MTKKERNDRNKMIKRRIRKRIRETTRRNGKIRRMKRMVRKNWKKKRLRGKTEIL